MCVCCVRAQAPAPARPANKTYSCSWFEADNATWMRFELTFNAKLNTILNDSHNVQHAISYLSNWNIARIALTLPGIETFIKE